ncbi:MAG: 30S ribosomal protein S15 [Planctomycetota bacterium]|nr:MAG: 30S ribosomal protein S15 [Planctomycetota bacterium]
MALELAERSRIVGESRRHETDTGSVEVQVSLLTARINQIADHLKDHKHDFSSRRGLLKMVGRRNRLLRYLARTDVDRYRSLIQRLGLRK